jgi:diacylglycerol kinase family enzyme
MNRLPLLFNPHSGTSVKDPDALLAGLPADLRERIEPIPFGPPWDFAPAIAQAAAADGPLFVWGGDGTVHHAGRALLEAGCPVPLAAVPGGSGNGLVRGLRTPLEAAGAVQRLLEGRELRMDVGRLDGVPFFNLCGTGFEAVVARDFERGGHRGFVGYGRRVLQLWRSHRPVGLGWDAEPAPPEPAGSVRERLRNALAGPPPDLPAEAWSLCIANLPTYGSGFWIAPGASPVDGVLQWARILRPGILDVLMELPAFFKEGAHTRLREEGRLRRAILRLDRPLPWHLDGEPAAERDRAELAVEPRAFRMQVTGDCPWE